MNGDEITKEDLVAGIPPMLDTVMPCRTETGHEPLFPTVKYSPTSKQISVYYPGDYDWGNALLCSEHFDTVMDIANRAHQEYLRMLDEKPTLVEHADA